MKKQLFRIISTNFSNRLIIIYSVHYVSIGIPINLDIKPKFARIYGVLRFYRSMVNSSESRCSSK